MDPLELLKIIFAIGILLAIAIFCIYMGFKKWDVWKQIDRIPTRGTMNLVDGPVEVKGYARNIPGQSLISPLTGTPCVSYNVYIQRSESRRNRKSHWKTIDRQSVSNDFLVEDNEGKVKVYSEPASFDMIESYSDVHSIINKAPDRVSEYMETRDVAEKGRLGLMRRTLRIIEEVIPVNQPIYVLGCAVLWPMEEILENDMFVSPYTITKNDIMLISAKGERSARRSTRSSWLLYFSIGGFFILLSSFMIVSILIDMAG